MKPSEPLEFDDIQGIALSGYANLKHARFVFIRFDAPESSRQWLSKYAQSIMTATRRAEGDRPDTAANIAFSYEGLQALGLDDDALRTFPSEFQEGMVCPERSRMLGDFDDSAPEKWDFGGIRGSAMPEDPDYKKPQPPHAVVMLYASSTEKMEEIFTALCPEQSGWTTAYCQDSFRDGVSEPFGFRDGISQPPIRGVETRVQPAEEPLNAGEFLLGYLNEYEGYSQSPTVAPSSDSENILPPAMARDGRKDLGRNGSYLVLRKLEQDVEGFKSFFRNQAETLLPQETELTPGTPEATAWIEQKQIWIEAKVVGRWPSGAPLAVGQTSDPGLGNFKNPDNALSFANDPKGLVCPIGAHVRRCNPRDSLIPTPEVSTTVTRLHRLLRRGRPFCDGPEGQQKQGLLFMALNTNIQRQFEFVQQTWVNSPKFGGLQENVDVLAGDNSDKNGCMIIPQDPVRLRIRNIPRFAETRGGAYFFLPGVRALRYLAKCQ